MTLENINIIALCLLMTMNTFNIFPTMFIYFVFGYFCVDFIKQIYIKNTSIIIHHLVSLILFYVAFQYNHCYKCINDMTHIEISSTLLLIYKKTKWTFLKYVFPVVWFYQRLIYLPNVLYNISQNNYVFLHTNPYIYIISFICLLIIQLLSIYWTYLIIQTIVKNKTQV